MSKAVMIKMLHDEPAFSELFLAHLMARNIRTQEDLVDQLFNSSEKRLARVLLLRANFGMEGKPETVIAKVSQEKLAEMVGTTRSRVSFFMNKFRKLGFIEYDGDSHKGLNVHSSLLNVVLHDQVLHPFPPVGGLCWTLPVSHMPQGSFEELRLPCTNTPSAA